MTSTDRTMKVSSSTPRATAKPISAKATIGSVPRAAKVPARTRPAEVMTAPVVGEARHHARAGALAGRLLADAGGQEDVVVDAQGHQEDEDEQREVRRLARVVEEVAEGERAEAQRGREGQDHRPDQQQRGDQGPQQQRRGSAGRRPGPAG